MTCYIGEPGGYGTYGHRRSVFFSDAAAPRIARIMKDAGPEVAAAVERAAEDRFVKAATGNKFVARRFDTLRDLVARESAT